MGISKGLAMQRILAAMAERCGPGAVAADFVLAAGHFLARDENLFTFFEGHALKARAAPPPDARHAACIVGPGHAAGCAVCQGRAVRLYELSRPGSQGGPPPPSCASEHAPGERGPVPPGPQARSSARGERALAALPELGSEAEPSGAIADAAGGPMPIPRARQVRPPPPRPRLAAARGRADLLPAGGAASSRFRFLTL